MVLVFSAEVGMVGENFERKSRGDRTYHVRFRYKLAKPDCLLFSFSIKIVVLAFLTSRLFGCWLVLTSRSFGCWLLLIHLEKKVPRDGC